MRPIGASNKFFYYTSSGTGTTFDMRFRLDFHDKIDIAALKSAVDKALSLFPEFAVRPVIKDNKLYYEENKNPAPVFLDDKISCFGTDDTNGYLFRFSCTEKSVLMSYYHGISDAIGVLTFTRSFLYFYAQMIGMEMPSDKDASTRLNTRISVDDIPDLDRQDTFDPYGAFAEDLKPAWHYDNPGAFVIPCELYPNDRNAFHLYDIFIPVHEFLKKTKEYGVSFAPLLVSISARAIANAYDTKGKPVNAMLPVNLRTQFNTKTVVNMSDGVILPLDEKMQKDSVVNSARYFNDVMRKQMTKENYCQTMFQKAAAVKNFEQKGDIFQVAHDAVQPAPKDAWKPITVPITYPGRLDFPSEYKELIDSTHVTALVRSSLAIVIQTSGDVLQIAIVQKLDDPKLVNAITSEFQAFGVHTEMKDLGIASGNMLLLEKLERK